MKQLYYYCEKCDNSWVDDYDKEYGECDSECSSCGSDYSPFTKKIEWLNAIRTNHLKTKNLYDLLSVFLNQKPLKKAVYTTRDNNSLFVDGYLNDKYVIKIFKRITTINNTVIMENNKDITAKVMKTIEISNE